jgi:hypothetical protein
MAISSNTEFVTTQNDIIRDAYGLLNIYGASESVNAADYEFASRFLNRMIKTWMAQGYHLWLKTTATMFLRKGQSLYSISDTSSDNVTDEYNETKVSADAVAGQIFVTVEDISTIRVGQYIGVVLDDLDLFWSTVSHILDHDVYFFGFDVLPTSASINKPVYTYTKKVSNPLDIYSMVRSQFGIDVPMNYLSYEEYFQLPNKYDSTTTPVSFNYDRQLNEAIIRIWQPPNAANFQVKITYSKKISNFDLNSDEPDFPMEWHEAIVYNLAIRLSPAFGKNKDAGFQSLLALGSQFLQNAVSFDNENGSQYIRPGRLYG